MATPVSIFDYIAGTWATLTRSHRNLIAAAADPKIPSPDGSEVVYVGPHEDPAAIEAQLERQMSPADFGRIRIRRLPEDLSEPARPGLLYLPFPYVVPGGRFNEMYGWDSFFIQMGLLRDGKVELAKNMADNFLYEIREYGKILNANRTYYLTRSQPPFLTEMVLAVYRRTGDRAWLESTVPAIETFYRYWTTEPHLTPETGLSRYIDLGEGPAPEVTASERDSHGRSDYELAREYFRAHHKIGDYDASEYYDKSKDQLTPLFYKGDRSMRESGFDPSNRFGPFSVDIIHYNPVCLNSLLYLMEKQTADIMDLLGRKAAGDDWRKKAADRAERINHLMWDPHDRQYFDYNFRLQRIRRYRFLATFYPLWAGISTSEQASGVAGNLPVFERAGGLETSNFRSGDQWDAPFGWAPLQWIAIEGLRHYGRQADANRLAVKFLSLVKQEYERYGTLEEKYDVASRTSSVVSELRYGYSSNEAGFGWTNAVFTTLFDQLAAADQRRVEEAR